MVDEGAGGRVVETDLETGRGVFGDEEEIGVGCDEGGQVGRERVRVADQPRVPAAAVVLPAQEEFEGVAAAAAL